MSFENRKTNSFDYEMWALAHREAPQSKTGKFLTLSMILHGAIFASLAILAVPLVEQTKVETVTIEIEETPRLISRGSNVPATQGQKTEASAAPTPVAQESLVNDSDFDSVVVEKPKTPKAAKAKAIKAARPTTKVARAAKPAPVIAEAAAPKVATIDDIDAPDIDAATDELKHSWTPSSPTQALADEDLAEVDEAHANALANEKGQLDQDLNALESDSEEALNDLKDQNEMNSAAIAERNKDRRARDAQNIAAAARAENAARAEAARKQALAAAAAKRKQEGSGRGQGNGAGAQGATAASTQKAGSPQGVRSLEQLRQMPGNRGPQYSRQERLNREQGTVSFVAYVTKEGFLTKFKKMSSTGHVNLDEKTLAALQKWKFYPGQEGWVELPFRWDIKGEPQAVDGLLRVSSNRY